MNFLKILAIPGIFFLVITGRTYSSEISGQELFIGTDYYHYARNSIEERVRSGEFFKPPEFWRQPVEKQLLFLEDAIRSSGVIQVVLKHYIPYGVSFFATPSGEPHTIEEATCFNKAIWKKLQIFLSNEKLLLSETEFYESLTINIDPSSHLSGAPLICHFSDYLCPQYDSSFSRSSSKFEIIIKDSIKPKVRRKSF